LAIGSAIAIAGAAGCKKQKVGVYAGILGERLALQ
jgi:hypothetical protein